MTASGNTHHGLIEEFPGIAVDKFNARANIFILTHAHSDHLTGLENDSFSNVVYCSELTKMFVSHDPKYRRVIHHLRTVKYNEPHMLVLDGEEIVMTFIQSYHCPGSCMVLLEGLGKAVLVTGDLRAEEWWTLSLRKNPYLFPYTTSFKTLDNIYFDSTFTYRGEPFIEMVPNTEGVDTAAQLLSLFPKDDPDIQFYFVDSTLGFEEAWSSIVHILNARFHASEKMQKRINVLSGPSKRVLKSINYGDIPPNHQIFHACGNNPEKCVFAHKPKFSIKVKQCIDFNIRDLAGMCLPLKLASLSEDEKSKDLTLIGETSMGNRLYRFRNHDWILPHNGHELLPTLIKLVFSRHSSYTETKNFISIFNTRQVYPCVESKESWMRGLSVSRMFGSLCSSDFFSYDYEKSKEFGKPSSLLLNRPITTINRWSVDECLQEENFVAEFLRNSAKSAPPENLSPKKNDSKITFKFLGQRETAKFLNDKDFIKQRRKDMKLQAIIIGRGEGKYKEFIEEQQNKYKGFGMKDIWLHQNHAKRIGNTVLQHNDHSDSETTESSLEFSFESIMHSKCANAASTLTNESRHFNFENKNAFTSTASTIVEETPVGTQMHLHPTNAFQHKPPLSTLRPRLNRINEPQRKGMMKSRASFVSSSYSSFEVSLTGMPPTKKPKQIQSISERGERNEFKLNYSDTFSGLHSVFYKTDLRVDEDAVSKLSDELQTNALYWFGLDLKST